jgi:flagellar hook-basal body complex protein FliE
MPIDRINFNNNPVMLQSLITAGQVRDAQPAIVPGSAPMPNFSSFLSEAVAGTITSDAESKALGIDFLLGGESDLHSVMIAGQKADVLLNLTVQIRNKMVESYQEVMRMQV